MFMNNRLFFFLVRNLIKLRKGENSEELKWKIRVCSENNFPTAAGLASSAAGYACLGLCISINHKNF